MPAWAEDPELLATFRAEVEERLASLQSGLLQLEHHTSPRQVIGGLFRDAHTVKGSARMLDLQGVLHVSHGIEDLLGALREGRFVVRRDLVDLLLASCDGIARALPGPGALSDDALAPLVDALKQAYDGVEPVVVPSLAAEPVAAEPVKAVAPRQPKVVEEPAPRVPQDSVRVAASKVYELLDAVGEADLDARRVEQLTGSVLGLAAEQARWVAAMRTADDLPPDVGLALHRLSGTGEELESAARDLRELVEGQRTGMSLVRDGAMGLAMVPVRRVFAALPRIVRDVGQATGKNVCLVMRGEGVELDKKVLDGIADALKHLVINAGDHGGEPTAGRVTAGKPAQSTITLSARSVGGTVVIEVGDDGAGVDEAAVRRKAVQLGLVPHDAALSAPALLNLLFTPSFSTSEAVTETSSRGVGLDVVRDAVEELGGSVEAQTQRGAGTTFTLTLPITLGVLRCLVARVGAERYAIPVPGVVESLSLRTADVHSLAGSSVVVRHGVSVPLLDLGAALGLPAAAHPRAALLVRHASTQVAWAVDRLEGESELVVKDLGSFLGRVPCIAGATIDSDGSVICLLDLRELAERAVGTMPGATPAPRPKAPSAGRKPRV